MSKCSACIQNAGTIPGDDATDSDYQVIGSRPSSDTIIELVKNVAKHVQMIAIAEYNAFDAVKLGLQSYAQDDLTLANLNALIQTWKDNYSKFPALVISEIQKSNDSNLRTLITPNLGLLANILEELDEEDDEGEAISSYVSALSDGSAEVPYTLNMKACTAWAFLALNQILGENSSYQIDGLDYTSSSTFSLENVSTAVLEISEMGKTLRSCMDVSNEVTLINLTSFLRLLNIIPGSQLTISALDLIYECNLTSENRYRITLTEFTETSITLLIESTEEELKNSDLSTELMAGPSIKVQLEGATTSVYTDLEINQPYSTTVMDNLVEVTTINVTNSGFSSAKIVKITSLAKSSDDTNLKDKPIKFTVSQPIQINGSTVTTTWEVKLNFTAVQQIIESTLTYPATSTASITSKLEIDIPNKKITKTINEAGPQTSQLATTVYHDNTTDSSNLNANEINIKESSA